VPARLDALLRDWANPAHRAAYVGALTAIDTDSKAKTGKPFALLPPAQRKSLLVAYDASRLGTDAPYTGLKDILLNLYYLSETGATVELRYEHAPGAWEASIPLTPKTRAWAGPMPAEKLLNIA